MVRLFNVLDGNSIRTYSDHIINIKIILSQYCNTLDHSIAFTYVFHGYIIKSIDRIMILMRAVLLDLK
jgi:3-deoxy-D-manno-octulosonate 8-phosphate phosphatase KdsC-like HAD superfamily phosphatase